MGKRRGVAPGQTAAMAPPRGENEGHTLFINSNRNANRIASVLNKQLLFRSVSVSPTERERRERESEYVCV